MTMAALLAGICAVVCYGLGGLFSYLLWRKRVWADGYAAGVEGADEQWARNYELGLRSVSVEVEG